MASSAAALFLVLASSFQVTATGSVRTETRAGIQPTGGSRTSDPSFDATISPSGGLTISRGSTAITAGYNLRLFRRFLVPALERFIILHTANASLRETFGKGWQLSLDSGARLGEVDYANLNTAAQTGQNPTTQGARPTAASIRLLTVTFGGGIGGKVGRNHSIGFGVNLDHQRPIGTIDPALDQGSIQQQTGASIGLNYGYQLGARTRLTTNGGINFTQFADRTDPASQMVTGGDTFRSGSVRAGVGHQISQRISGSISGGVLLSDGQSSGFLAAPVGNLDFTARWSDTAAFRFGNQLTMSVAAQPNPVLGTVDPRGDVRLGFDMSFGADWTLRLDGNLSTPLPIQRTGGTVPVSPVNAEVAAETVISANLPISYRINNALRFDFGASAQVSGSRLDADQVQFFSPSVTGFVALSASVSSGPL